MRGLVIPRSTWLVGEIESKFEMEDGFECVFRDRVARGTMPNSTHCVYNIDRIMRKR